MCVEAGIFHDFRQTWTEKANRALNAGTLSEG